MPRQDRWGGTAARAAETEEQGYTLDETETTLPLHSQIKIKGALDQDWLAWFDGLTITHDAAGDTLLQGAVRDQTALYDLLAVEQRTTATESDPLAPPVTRLISHQPAV
jgi:hypothetical protein